MKKLIKKGIGNIVGIGLIGASSSAVNSLDAGTTKNIAGIVPGLQSVALVGSNLDGLSFKTKRKLNHRRKK